MPQEGKPIWVESLLTPEEYKIQAKKFPSTFTKGDVAPAIFDCEMYWRRGMGAALRQDEIILINKRLDAALKTVKEAKMLGVTG